MNIMNTSFVNAAVHDGKASLFEQLPPDLLHQIFHYTLPHGLTFSFEQSKSAVDNSSWILFAARGKHAPRALVNKLSTKVLAPHRRGIGQRTMQIYEAIYRCGVCEKAHRCEYELRPEDVCSGLALLYVNRALAREARGESQNDRSQICWPWSVLTYCGFHFRQEHLQLPHHRNGGLSYLPQIAACIWSSWLATSHPSLVRLEMH